MKRFVKLTSSRGGNEIYIKADQITSFSKNDSNAVVVFVIGEENPYFIREKINEVVRLVDEALQS